MSSQVVNMKAIASGCDHKASCLSLKQAYQQVQHWLDQWKRQCRTVPVPHQPERNEEPS